MDPHALLLVHPGRVVVQLAVCEHLGTGNEEKSPGAQRDSSMSPGHGGASWWSRRQAAVRQPLLMLACRPLL
jgi:hypothetical protein